MKNSGADKVSISKRFTWKRGLASLALVLLLVTPALVARSLRPQIFRVTTPLDSGPGSLRQAILDANAALGDDTILFQIAPGGHQVISLLTPLPAITAPVTLDATTQPGYEGTPVIELEGSQSLTSAMNGLQVSASDCIVRGLALNRFGQAGILLDSSASGTTIEHCYIGTDAGGSSPLGNDDNLRI